MISIRRGRAANGNDDRNPRQGALLLVGRPMSAGSQRGAAKIPVVLLNVRSTWRKSAGRLMRVTLDWVRSANGFHAEPRGARTRG